MILVFGIVAYVALFLFMVLNLISLIWGIILHLGLIIIILALGFGFIQSKHEEIKERRNN